MNKRIRTQKIDTVFVLVIFCIFAASVLITLMFSGSVYKTMTDKSNEKYIECTGLSYIWLKSKSFDVYGGIYTDNFYDLSVLCLEEEYEGVTYLTMVYLYDGWIRELFSEKGMDFLPDDGTPIIEAEALYFEQMNNGLIKATVNGDSIIIYPRGKVGLKRSGF